ncbi:acyl carrier protein [Pseudoalteromonas sp. T1lg65]|uniref:acyl carrier protein n=1 Tax=Pseudoalteromonas sp. T1lg65 TaxID=2077101 RepID=UPI003F7ACA3B
MKEILRRLSDLLADRADFSTMSESQLAQYRPLDTGIIDSFGLMQFLMSIEEEFEIELDPEDTQSEEFRSLGGIAEIIKQKQSQ